MRGKFEAPRKKRKKWPWIVGVGVFLAVCVLVFFLLFPNEISMNQPVLAVETPQKISLSQGGEFSLDVTVSDLGEAIYPAASMSIAFDASCLEFLGVEEGNVFITADENGAGEARQLPDWSCNVQKSNETGLINIMYLDMTGGKYAFHRDLLAEDDNVVLRLRFRMRGSARVGDAYELVVEDAVFAASDESQSLAMTTGSLRAKNGRIVTGE